MDDAEQCAISWTLVGPQEGWDGTPKAPGLDTASLDRALGASLARELAGVGTQHGAA